MNSFTDYFWGDKNNGFDVLYHNMKCGQDSCREFADFLRESCAVEETYCKLLAKLAKYTQNFGAKGSFGPYWVVLKSVAEKLCGLHQQLVVKWQDLLKDVNKYHDEQHKKHKAVKDQEAGTIDTVQSIQQTITLLQKAKETYHARCLEYEKLKRDNATLKDLEKAETKYKKANEDYRNLLDKYCNIRNEFEVKMSEACKKFQETEEQHLEQMREYVDTYYQAWETQHTLLGQVHQEFRTCSNALTVDKLLLNFVQTKTTGTNKPGAIEFIEADLSSLAPATPDNGRHDFPVIEKPKKEGGGFLKKRRKEKKSKKKVSREKEEDTSSAENVPKVDEQGFSIPPEHTHNNTDANSWYSSSADSDSDGDERRNKIKVEIKPIAAPAAMSAVTSESNIADIRQSMDKLRLSPCTVRRGTPTSEVLSMKKSMSLSDNLAAASTSNMKPSQDLMGLDIFGITTTTSSTSTTTDTTVTTPSYNGVEVSSSVTDSAPALPARPQSQTPTGAPLIPGPPPPRTLARTNKIATATARPAGRQTPDIFALERADSVASLSGANFSTTSASFGSSRGPSPVTLGHADTVPLAVAFSETVNAYFKGDDDLRCKVKLTGDLMLSFPAGIARTLTDNPSPATLSFKVNNVSALEHILVNKQLLSEDVSQASSECRVYSFDMTSLTEHLRKQAEQSRSASYFNIDIIKYQIRAKPGAQSVPVKLTSKWKCEEGHSEFRLDYKLNPAALPHLSTLTLSNATIILPVTEDLDNLITVPAQHTRSPDNKRVMWRLGDIPGDSDSHTGEGIIRARYDCPTKGTPSPAALQFVCERATLSGVDFELAGSGYRVSLIKKRFISGKYIAECDSGASFV